MLIILETGSIWRKKAEVPGSDFGYPLIIAVCSAVYCASVFFLRVRPVLRALLPTAPLIRIDICYNALFAIQHIKVR